MGRIRNTQKLKRLLGQEKRVFRTSDLSVLWGIENKNTLYNTLSRYVKRGLLYRIYKGVYSTVPIKKLHDYELGCALCGPLSYISGETILSKEGLIFQEIKKITLFGRKERSFEVSGRKYYCRYLNPKYLMNRIGISDGERYSNAGVERALADLLYIDPEYYIDNQIALNKLDISSIKEKLDYAHT
ncbi:hypothetical protein GF389_03885 [Candidatus Dojkabacteria bacterium]|nr:hypothetical protein [Candidatus Dojkabacteria bacterium]